MRSTVILIGSLAFVSLIALTFAGRWLKWFLRGKKILWIKYLEGYDVLQITGINYTILVISLFGLFALAEGDPLGPAPAIDPELQAFSEALYALDQAGNAAKEKVDWDVNTYSKNGKYVDDLD